MHPNPLRSRLYWTAQKSMKKFTEYCQILRSSSGYFPKRSSQPCPSNHKKHLCDRWKSTYKDEFVTCGGIPWKEIDPKTMQSRLAKVYFFAGEVVDSDGITGDLTFKMHGQRDGSLPMRWLFLRFAVEAALRQFRTASSARGFFSACNSGERFSLAPIYRRRSCLYFEVIR